MLMKLPSVTYKKGEIVCSKHWSKEYIDFPKKTKRYYITWEIKEDGDIILGKAIKMRERSSYKYARLKERYKKMEEKCKKMEENYVKVNEEYNKAIDLFEKFQNSSYDGFWDWNLETNEEYLSPRFKEMFGYLDDEMENSVESWQRIIHPDDLVKARKCYDECVKFDKPYNVIVRYYHKNGSIVWVICRGTLIRNEEGNPVRMVGIHTDITEEKEMDEKLSLHKQRLNLAVSGANVGIWDWNLITNELYWSKELLNMLGIPKSKFSKQVSFFFERVHPDDCDMISERHRMHIEKNYDYDIEFRIRHEFGHYIWANAKGKIIRNENYVPIRMIGSFLDVTDRVKIINDLKIAKKSAEDASISKGIFLANMSHEIRTPLNGILGICQLMIEMPNNEEMMLSLKDNIMIIDNCSRTLLSLVNDILDYSKIEANKISLDNMPFDIIKTLMDIAKTHNIMANEKGIKMEMMMEADFPKIVKGDKLRFSQIMNNVLSNAIKFTDKGGVTLIAKSENKGGDYKIEISVQDTGVGISDGDKKRLFRTFSQVGGHNRGGTGLGLVIAESLCKMMGGSINISSKIGEGTVVSIELIFNGSKVVHIEPEMSNMYEIIYNLSILVVEDNKVNQIVVKKFLESLGKMIKYKIVSDGPDAVRECMHTYYDIIFMDMNLITMNGCDATLAIRNLDNPNKNSYIVAMTANATKDDKKMCLDSGMDDYISKPISFNDTRYLIYKVQYDIINKIKYNEIKVREVDLELMGLFKNECEVCILNMMTMKELENIKNELHKIKGMIPLFGDTYIYEMIIFTEDIYKNQKEYYYEEAMMVLERVRIFINSLPI